MGSLEREGWLSTQSQQTQETQLNPEKREPRCVFGRTSQKRLILAVISGRSRISCGATFSESTKFVRELLKENEKLDFLINFDGGASASLIANDNGSCKNLSMTAPSAGNPAGIPRRLNTYFSLNIK
nr:MULTISPECIES: phosphodiester glycosidase family protein [unclassified Oceanispirochaeta]